MTDAAPGATRVAVVGAGRVGAALAALLARHGVELVGLWSRSEAGAAAASDVVGRSCAHGPFPAEIGRASLIILAVRDPVLHTVAGALLDGGLLRSARVVLHCGGARPAAEALAPLAGCGASRGTLHPLLAVADAARGATSLGGAFFAVEGDPAARAAAGALVRGIGARFFELDATQMTGYHAAAVLASNHPVALWAAAAELLGQAGVPGDVAPRALAALARSVLDNVERLGPSAALTGPVQRGDLDTVRRHLDLLVERAPALAALYRACSLAAVRIVEDLDGADAALAAIRRLLERD